MPITQTASSTSLAKSISLGQIEVAQKGAVLTCPGLGSCLGVVAMDKESGVNGAVIIMLPESAGSSEHPGRYANLAVKVLLQKMVAEGANQEGLKFAVAGGAKVFRGAGSSPNLLDIGGRNTSAVMAQFDSLELTCVAQETGGESARAITLDSSSGRVTVKTTCGGERLLCNLGE